MTEIVPAIISDTFDDISKKIEKLEPLVDWVHLDVMDNTLVKRQTWSSPEDLKNVPGKIKIEAHLMIQNPEEFLVDWVSVVDRVIVHVEAGQETDEIIKTMKNSACHLSLALMLNTPMEELYKFLDNADFTDKSVLLMGIDRLGFSGEAFDERVLSRIELLRKNFPDVKIKVDGGINLSTAQKAKEAGANSLVANSAIWEQKNIEEAINEFKKL